MKSIHRRWLLRAVCFLFALDCCLGQMPAARGGDDPEELIFSVLQREGTVFVSTDLGLFRAALSDKVWHKLPLPESAPVGGYLASEAAPSSVLVYVYDSGRFKWIAPEKKGVSGLFVSKDLGQTWERTALGRDFTNAFVQSGGDLYACERMQTPEPPLNPDKESSAWTFDAKGQKLWLWYRVLVSHDLGKNWLDLSGDVSTACSYGFFRDLDHPELIRLIGAPEVDQKRVHYYEADDGYYVWKQIPWEKWRRDPSRQEEYVFRSLTPGSDDDDLHADRATLLKYPFLKWGNFLSLHAVQIETEKPAYTFRQHERMPVALRAGFIFSRKPLQFADNEDEAVCWLLRGISEKGYTFSTSAKAAPPAADDEARMAEYRADPRTRINTLDDDHPYRRTVDLSKLYDFAEPGHYRVQLVKQCCPFFKEDAGFTGQVIDVTITP